MPEIAGLQLVRFTVVAEAELAPERKTATGTANSAMRRDEAMVYPPRSDRGTSVEDTPPRHETNRPPARQPSQPVGGWGRGVRASRIRIWRAPDEVTGSPLSPEAVTLARSLAMALVAAADFDTLILAR